jgi:uncharacterized membrane protein YeaQ/YmgE (transglycosylase-associated protein family)
LYWLRISMGVLAGASAETIFGTDSTDGLLVGVIFYLASYYVARYFWFKRLDKKNLGKIYSTGIGGYILLFLFTWILLFTLVSG